MYPINEGIDFLIHSHFLAISDVEPMRGVLNATALQVVDAILLVLRNVGRCDSRDGAWTGIDAPKRSLVLFVERANLVAGGIVERGVGS